MANQWFKFYGQDFQSDPKMLRLNPTQRLMWVYLLCQASQTEDGVIKNIDENMLKALSHLNPEREEWELADNVLEIFKNLKMIEVKGDTILVINYRKHQERYLTDAEKQQRHRDKIKASNDSHPDQGDEVTTNRVEENRIDIYIVLFNFWNDLGVIRHRIFTNKMRTKIKSVLNDYTEADIRAAMTNYATVVKGPEYFFKYKWTLDEFLSRGLVRFLEAPIDNWLKEKGQDTTNSLNINNPKWKNL